MTAPLTSADCDLRDFAYMPLDVVRLRDSDLAAIDAEAFRAAVLSWCVAWHQSPAASLPDDDAALCRLLGYGRDLKGWQKVRKAGALRGYVLCDDGRLYHPVVAQKALEAWQKKHAQRDRTEAARRARLSQTMSQEHERSQSQPLSHDLLQAHAPPVTDNVTGSKGREGKGEEGKEGSELRSAPDPKAVLWRDGLAALQRMTGQDLTRTRKLLGKLVDASGADHVTLNALIAKAEIEQPDDPVSWLMAAAKQRNGHAQLPLAAPEWPPEVVPEPKDGRPTVDGRYLDWMFETACDRAHIELPFNPQNAKPVIGWLAAKIEQEDILNAIRRCADRPGYTPPRTLAWFDNAVREQRA